MDYHYKCSMRTGRGTESWTAGIDLLKVTKTGQYEAEIEGRGTYFHVIAGRHKYGNFLCIPNFNIGCELSDLSDLNWITERLSMFSMRKVDIITVATGISHLEKAAAASR